MLEQRNRPVSQSPVASYETTFCYSQFRNLLIRNFPNAVLAALIVEKSIQPHSIVNGFRPSNEPTRKSVAAPSSRSNTRKRELVLEPRPVSLSSPVASYETKRPTLAYWRFSRRRITHRVLSGDYDFRVDNYDGTLPRRPGSVYNVRP